MPSGERERGRMPDYEIKALDKATQERGKIGAAWLQDDGSIYIKFERFAAIPTGKGFAITAFPVEEEGPYERPRDHGRHTESDAEPRRGHGLERRAPRRRPSRSRS